jgi:ABC-type lipoprotein export system ATPase subunit
MSLGQIECVGVAVHVKDAAGEDKALLQGIDFAARAGEICALSGHTGAGKSTLLHLLAGLLRPSVGEVRADSEVISRWTAGHRDEWRRRVGLLFQGAELIEGLRAAENILAPLVPRASSTKDKLAAMQRSLELLDLQAVAGQTVRELSGGERQRVALARAIVGEPELLLLDEPSAHQDDEHLGLVLRAIAAARSRGAVVVLATHDPRILEWTELDAVVHMERGRILEVRGQVDG